jgi:hypothetical protein
VIALGAGVGLWLASLWLSTADTALTEPAAAATPAVITLTAHQDKHQTVTSVPVGTTLHPFVTVGGTAGPGTGGVSASIWLNDLCKGTASQTAGGALAGGSIEIGLRYRPMATGFVSFRATYAGSATYAPGQSACVAVQIVKASPTLAMQWHDANHDTVTEIYVTQRYHARFVLTGPVGAPSGELVMSFYSSTDCSGDPLIPTTYAVPDTGIAESTTRTANTEGAITARGVYAGSDVYRSKTGPCLPLTVKTSPLSLIVTVHRADHTELSGAEQVGHALHPEIAAIVPDLVTAPVSGLSLRTYDSSDCTGTSLTLQVVGFIDNATKTDVLAAPGVHSWKVAHNGGHEDYERAEVCTTVRWKAPSHISMAIHDAEHHNATAFVAGDAVHPAATLGGDFGIVAGQIRSSLYRDGSCGTLVSAIELGASGAYDPETGAAPGAPRTYSWRVEFLGNVKYFPSTGPCKSFTVSRATPALDVELHDPNHHGVFSVPVGTGVHERFEVTGTVGAGAVSGVVLITSFDNATCTGSGVSSSQRIDIEPNPIDVIGFVVAPPAPGTYSVQARVSASGNYGDLIGPCQQFVVLAPGATPPPTPPPPTVAPTLDPGATTAAATLDPGATLAPGQTLAAGQTLAPSQTLAPGQTLDPVAPTASGGSGSLAPGLTAPPGGSQAPGTGGPAGSSGGDGGLLPVLLLVLLVGIGAAAGGWFLARRSRAG